MKVAFILGTRPEIIKLSSLIRLCQAQKIPFTLIHTNQHYSENMDKVFFEELELPAPTHNLGIGSGSHGDQTARMMQAIEPILMQEKPDVVFIQGDTNSVLAGALVAAKIPGIQIAHVEAGLRSYDWTMPEEVNRIATDHISHFLFAPTPKQETILLGEGIPQERIHVVGNTVVDAVVENRAIAAKKLNIWQELGIKKDDYLLLTAHRPANVDNATTLANLIAGVTRVAEQLNLPVIFPIHPRTKKNLETFGIALPKDIRIIEPVGYLAMLQLQEGAKLILTDSGGVQEEACILERPCVTLRENTERPETVDVGGNILAGTDSNKIVTAATTLLTKTIHWTNPFGTGTTASQILSVVDDKGRYESSLEKR